jgi:signal transduction histidine kinase
VQVLSAGQVERLVAVLRLFGLVAGLALIELTEFPNSALAGFAWSTMVLLALACVPLWFWGSRTNWSSRTLLHVGFVVDVLLIVGYAVGFAHLQPNVSWCVAFTVLADATMRYGQRGVAMGFALAVGVVALQAWVHELATGEPTPLVNYAFVVSTLVGVAGVLWVFSRLFVRRSTEHRDQSLALADALELQERGIAAVAHEFRGALAVIVGSARTARQKRDRLDDEHLTLLLGDIESQGQRVEQLVDGLLSHQPDRPGALAVRARHDDVALTVARALDASARHRRNHDLQLDLPSTVCTLDHERLQQVVRNLVDNAYQHTAHGGVVAVAVRRLGVTVEVRVTDRGDGIDPVRLQRALAPFRRGIGTGDDEAAGLGLYLVHQIVAAMGGTVEIRTSGAGTDVAVRVPATHFAHDREPAG